ncbi:hypothetical protein WOC76_01325 [Methylocystis sp. IM3]|uniref:hypothetical protein n=1 Tax=unclassified Methylocystis TaxID=2625913 RepID=UPI0030F8A460
MVVQPANDKYHRFARDLRLASLKLLLQIDACHHELVMFGFMRGRVESPSAFTNRKISRCIVGAEFVPNCSFVQVMSDIKFPPQSACGFGFDPSPRRGREAPMPASGCLILAPGLKWLIFSDTQHCVLLGREHK